MTEIKVAPNVTTKQDNDLSLLVLPKFTRHSTIECHTPASHQFQNEEKLDLHGYFKKPREIIEPVKVTSLEEWSSKKSLEAIAPESPDVIIKKIWASGIPFNGQIATRFIEFETALKQEYQVNSATSQTRIIEDLTATKISIGNNLASQFALGRLITAVSKDPPESTTKEFVETALSHAKSPSTQLAALKLAELRQVQVSEEVLSPFRESDDVEITAIAARLSARDVKDYASIKIDLEKPISPLSNNASAFLAQGHLSTTLEPSLTEINSSNEQIRRKQILSLETLLSRPDIEVPGGIDKHFKRFFSESNGVNFTLDFLRLDRHNEPRKQLEDLALRFADANRLENPIEVLRSALDSNGKSNAEILQYISQHQELIKQYSIGDLMQDRAKIPGMVDRPYRADINLDARFTDILSRRMQLSSPNLDLEPIAPSVVNMLSHVREHYPASWKVTIETQNTDTLAIKLAESINQERQQLIERNPIIMGKGVQLLIAVHEDPGFQISNIKNWGQKFEMEFVDGIKGDKDPFITADRKELLLEHIKKLASDQTKAATIYFDGHGGPNHFYLSSGTIDQAKSDDMFKPNAVSYIELAKTMLAAQTDTGITQINLSNCNFIHDSCLQHDFIKQFHKEVFRLADERGLEITGMPLMVSASQSGQPANGIPFSLYKDSLERIMPQAPGPLRLEHLLSADSQLKKRVDMTIELPATDKFLMHSSQDPALFSPQVTPQTQIEAILRSILPTDAETQESIDDDVSRKPARWTNEVSYLQNPSHLAQV